MQGSRRASWLALIFVLWACSQSASPPSKPKTEATPPADRDLPHPIRHDPWAERSDAEVEQEIAQALQRAGKHDKHVLLDFGAPWCTDCRALVSLFGQEPVRSTLHDGFEVVAINVGRFDRHRALIAKHGVDRIAKLVVLDASGQTRASTTVEPLSGERPVSAQGLAEWLQQATRSPP